MWQRAARNLVFFLFVSSCRAFGFIPTNLCGEVSSPALTGPLDRDGDCESGTSWYSVPGYNNGDPFQAYTDVSVDGQTILVFHHALYVGEVRHNQPTSNDYTGFGAPSWGSSFRLNDVGTLLTALCPPHTRGSARFYIGQHDADGIDFTSASNLNWIALTDKDASEFADMFGKFNPGTREFMGSGLRRGDGEINGVYQYRNDHGSTDGVHQMSQGNSANLQVLFEWTAPFGGDPNHGWTVWNRGDGVYYNNNRPGSTSRYGWMGVSGC